MENFCTTIILCTCTCLSTKPANYLHPHRFCMEDIFRFPIHHSLVLRQIYPREYVPEALKQDDWTVACFVCLAAKRQTRSKCLPRPG